MRIRSKVESKLTNYLWKAKWDATFVIFILASFSIQKHDLWAESASTFIERSKNNFPLVGTGGYFEITQIFAFLYNKLQFINLFEFSAFIRIITLLIIVSMARYFLKSVIRDESTVIKLLMLILILAIFLHPSTSSLINVFLIFYIPHIFWVLKDLVFGEMNADPPNAAFLLLAALAKPSLAGFVIIIWIIYRKKANLTYGFAAIALLYQFLLLHFQGPYTNFSFDLTLQGICVLTIGVFQSIGSILLVAPFLYFQDGQQGVLVQLSFTLGLLIVMYSIFYATFKNSDKDKFTRVFKAIMILALFFAITFNEFQWNLNSTESISFQSEVEKMMNSTFFTSSWKYKLQYHIINLPVLVYVLNKLISISLRTQLSKKLQTITISIILLFLVIPNYTSRSSETTVNSDWFSNVKFGVLPKDSCLPISPLADWGFQLSGSFDASNWIANSCHGLWLKKNMPIGAQWDPERLESVFFESSNLDKTTLMSIHLITEVPNGTTKTCFSPLVRQELIFKSQQKPTRSNLIYTLVGVPNDGLKKFIDTGYMQFECGSGFSNSYPTNIQVLYKN